MHWALVYLICSRFCEPQYVELYATKAECAAQETVTKLKCVPVANPGAKK